MGPEQHIQVPFELSAKAVRRASVLVLLLSMLLICSCGQRGDESDSGAQKLANPELERNKNLWRESKIANYNFVIAQVRGGSWRWVQMSVKVRNGQAVSIEPETPPDEYAKTGGYDDFSAVEKIFDQIQSAYNKKYIVEVTYNRKYGFPEKTKINPLTNAHSGYAYEISKFEIVSAESSRNVPPNNF
jgi:hypothetical protein